eukprot:4854494-Pyramimonas_sp.AAC.1
MRWSVPFNRELSSYEATFDNESIVAWIHTDERLILSWNHWPTLSNEIQDRVLSVPWEDDG